MLPTDAYARMARGATLSVLFFLSCLQSALAADVSGSVVDVATCKPIPNAIVTSGSRVARTNETGLFHIETTEQSISARAYGYGRVTGSTKDSQTGKLTLALPAIKPRAVYLSFWGISSAAVREPVLRLAGITPVNAVVIDVKGDLGYISYRASVPLAAQIGAEKTPTIPDVRALLDRLHRQGIYTIARIVTFKDNVLAASDAAIQVRMNGKMWRDREGLAWCDPFLRKVWTYNIDLAIDAAKSGFDEIQFDYVRFPDAKGIEFSQASTEDSRSKTITDFLIEAHKALIPYNVFLSADVFGYICWNKNDTGIGQKVEKLGAALDYISPMLYPSGFSFGIPNFRNPVGNSYEIVRLSLDRARERTGLEPVRFRPWLQAFADYAFDKRQFGADEIQAQIRAAESFGADGWLLWNPRNSYSASNICQIRRKPDQSSATNAPALPNSAHTR